MKSLSKLWTIKSVEYYSTVKIIIMKAMNNKEKCLHYDVRRKKWS